MTQTNKRGRPRKFDEDETLDRIMQVFWKHGYAATSLDQIAAETGLNRPSLYGAFGSKKSMFLQALDRFSDQMHVHLREAGMSAKGANGRMKAIMSAAIDLYTGRTRLSGAPYGCLAISTLPSEAAQDPEMQAALEKMVHRMDKGFASLIRYENGTNLTEPDIQAKAQQLSLVLHGISIRARSGTDANSLKQLAYSAVDSLLPVT
ncbi:MAG: TetR/AcrR family transcriptional regulator [Roseibium sp.]|uniref:TetR/AcrR family transcriptional regulator n=1 Tax=Roseibium sp. TaxID=1936156 RepID=UPI001B0DB27D|nr:TetR/AcrR family transcriptional regulator [Roseibium sp.]MBO6891463.1 TetR/AcrR family transcriptional regulator [Roseibium sp.]MBO6931347.1 TetR/AcrR family transcriptional regulator [Roseibium sp.]